MSDSVKKSSMLGNASLNVIRTVVTYAFPLISFMYGSRLFGTNGVGEIQFAQSYTAYFVLLAMLGIEKYGIREASQVRDDKRKLSKLAQELMIINGCSVCLAYGILILTLVTVPKLESYSTLILINSLTIGLTAAGLNWLYVAMEDFMFVTVRNVIVNAIALIVLFVFVRSSEDIVLFVTIQTLAATGANVLNLVHSRKYISFKKQGTYSLARHLKPIMLIFAMTLFIEIYTHLDTTMLGFQAGNRATGLYAAAHKVCGMLTAVITAAALVMMPRMTTHASKGDKKEIADLSSKTIHSILMFSIPCAVGVFLLSANLIVLFSGEEFLDATITAKILSGRVLLSSLNAFFILYLFIPLKKERVSLFSTGVAAILNFVLNLVLIPVLAENGASIATVFAEVAELCINLVVFSRLMSVRTAFAKIWKYFLASLSIVAIYGLSVLANMGIYIQLVFVVVLSIPAYFALLLLFKEPLVIWMKEKVVGKKKSR